MPEQRRLHPQLVELAREQGIPLLATNDTHYTVAGPVRGARPAASASRPRSNVDTPGRMRFEANEFYLKSAAEMRRLFNGELPDAMDNTLRVAEMCDVQPRLHRAAPPALPGAGRRDRRVVAAQGVRARDRGPICPPSPMTVRQPARVRARDHRPDGVLRLLPDRGRLHPLRPGAGDHDHLPGERARLDRHLLARHHAGRPARLRAAVRALPQPGPGDDAGHRHRLPGLAPRRGDRVRHAASTATTGWRRSSPSGRWAPRRRSATWAARWGSPTRRRTGSRRRCRTS